MESEHYWIESTEDPDIESLRAFALGRPDSNYCQDPAWGRIAAEAYGKKSTYYIVRDAESRDVTGFAQAVHLKSLLFGSQLVCLPYLDFGAPLSVDGEAEALMVQRLREDAEALKAKLEIRSNRTIPSLGLPDNAKVSMVLSLQGRSQDAYWKELDAKVRNQVRKAEKSGVSTQWGGRELLDDFYRVFCINMRDLGSPVHARSLFDAVLKYFPGAKIGAAYREAECIGGLFRIQWKDTMVVPWASALRSARSYNPNNALYWDVLQQAFAEGCDRFDFGRSTQGEGTYRFKQQWLAEEKPLCWYQFDTLGRKVEKIAHLSNGGASKVADLWSRMPLSAANYLGPRLRPLIAA